jgi:hypothetical protein
VVTTNSAVRQFKIGAERLCKLLIATAIPFVILQSQIADVKHATWTKNPKDFTQNTPLTLICRDAGQNTKQDYCIRLRLEMAGKHGSAQVDSDVGVPSVPARSFEVKNQLPERSGNPN